MTETAITKMRKSAAKQEQYVEAVGRRKTSIARVRLTPAKHAAYNCNERSIDSYFPTEELRMLVDSPMQRLNLDQKYAVSIHVRGGGMKSQAEAVRHGIARALTKTSPELRKPLKREGLLSRDARAKERRKFGLKKARKAPQWSKR